MVRELNVIGTDHRYQRGAGCQIAARGCSVDGQAAFMQLLRDISSSHGVDAIAEELNEQQLVEAGSLGSVAKRIANDLGLLHLFCDPNSQERKRLEIRSVNDIAADVQLANQDASVVEPLAAESWTRRETEWLRRLHTLAVARILFVCGSDHVDTFLPRACDSGFAVNLIHRDWPET